MHPLLTPHRHSLVLLGLVLSLLLPASTLLAEDKPPPSSSMFESTREPASAEESAAVVSEVKSKWSAVGPALFVRGYLVDRVGMGLYVFDRDRPGVSTCYRACEKLWPPLLAALDDAPVGEFGIIDRLYGARQWTWRGQPLYYWPYDDKPGDRTGDNVSGVWHLVLEPEGEGDGADVVSAAIPGTGAIAESEPTGAGEQNPVAGPTAREEGEKPQTPPAETARGSQQETRIERATERRLQRERERSEDESAL